MELKHTKGNWEITGNHITPLEVVIEDTNNGNHLWCRIALIDEFDHQRDRINYSEKLANAKLIAAAPEMLKALIELQQLATKMDRSDLKLTFEMMQTSFNAIKKATE